MIEREGNKVIEWIEEEADSLLSNAGQFA